MKRKQITIIATILLLVLVLTLTGCSEQSGTATSTSTAATAADEQLTWNKLLLKYRDDDQTKQLLFVQGREAGLGRVQMYEKDPALNNSWTNILECDAYIGKNGLGKEKEGDNKTPEGEFGILTAFGIKPDPGTRLPYLAVTDDLYCCDDENYYNQLISTSATGHECEGEHLIDYSPHYNYGLFLDYNKECEVGKGSAIFLHCSGPNEWTAGCIAVSEANMAFILQHCDPGVKVCIYSIDMAR